MNGYGAGISVHMDIANAKIYFNAPREPSDFAKLHFKYRSFEHYLTERKDAKQRCRMVNVNTSQAAYMSGE